MLVKPSSIRAVKARTFRCGLAVLTFILGSSLLPTLGHAQFVEWAQTAGGADSDQGQCIAVDINGNSYVAGQFMGNASIGTLMLTSAGSDDIFLAKYGINRNLLWAKSAGGASIDQAMGIAVDAVGNSYVTGHYTGTATFGSFMLTSAGSEDIFVVKYDSNGNVLWAQSAGGTTTDIGLDIAVDTTGNIYVTGFFQSTATFGSLMLMSAGLEDVFVTKYDSGGNVLWVQSAGGTSTESGQGIAVDTAGNLYVTGYYSGTLTTGPFMLTSAGFEDVFVFKLDNSGAVVWAQSAGGGIFNDRGNDIAVDATGNSFVTGFFHGTANFGSSILVSAGLQDIFIASYDSSGNVLWAQSAGGSSTDSGHSITVNAANNSYVTGIFHESADFGLGILTSAGSGDVFVAKYDSIGALLWARSSGGTSTESGQGIAVDTVDNVYVTGFYQLTATFGCFMLTSVGAPDIFVIKYSDFFCLEPPVVAPNPPVIAAAPFDLLKTKYISIDASVNGMRKLAIKVTETTTGKIKWAGILTPGTNIIPLSPLVNTPYIVDWSSFPVLHLTGCIIQPLGAYEITFVEDPFDTALSSIPLAASTACAWGDVQAMVDSCDVGIGDIVEAININTFSPLTTFAPPHGDVQGDTMDGDLGIADIIATINGATVAAGTTPPGYTLLVDCP